MKRELLQRVKKWEYERIEWLETLKERPEQQLRKHPKSGKWSVLEILYHLWLAEKGTLGYMQKKHHYSSGELPKASWWSWLKTRALLAGLSSPLKTRAPEVIAVFPETIDWDELTDQWSKTRKELYDFVEQLPESDLKGQLFKHPFIGRVSGYDSITIMHHHFIHHKRQIRHLLTSHLS